MSKNKRKAPAEHRRTMALGLFFLCAAIAIGAVGLLLSDKGNLAANSNPQPASTNLISTPTNRVSELPPLPDDPAKLLNIGNTMLERGYPAEAIRIYLEALKKNPEDEEAHFSLGFAYLRQQMTNEAIKHYEESLRIFPDYAEAHNNLGNIFVGQRKYDQAIEHFSAALKLSPENSSAMNNLGRALAFQGKTKEAIPHFQAAIRVTTNYLEAHFSLANAYLSLTNSELADAEYREVLRIDPQFGPRVEAARMQIQARAATQRAAATN